MMFKFIHSIVILSFLLSFVGISNSEDDKRQPISFDSFKKIAILENGRVKPLETYARNILLQFSGKRTYNNTPAIAWLVRVLFTPSETQDDKIFLIHNPEIPLALGLLPEPKRRYSISQLGNGYHKLQELALVSSTIEEKERTIVENEIIRVFQNMQIYYDLSQSFQFATPHTDFSVNDPLVADYLQLPRNQNRFSFVDIALRADAIEKVMASLQTKDVSLWTPFEREVVFILTNLYQWSLRFSDSSFLIIAPLQTHKEVWMSPWAAIGQGFQVGYIRNEIIALKDLYAAYTQGHPEEFDEAAQKFVLSIQTRSPHIRPLKYIDLELLFNRLNPFLIAQWCYGLAFVTFLISLFQFQRLGYQGGLVLIAVGALPHLWGIISRIIVLGRPPISSLYETFIFVGFGSVLMGIVIEIIHKRGLGIVIASVCGFILLLIARKFSAEGDTMKMLVAVLNSNFWLSIHVPNITMGYASCCVAGILGHIYLIQSMIRPHDQKQLEGTYRTLLGMLGVGLTFSFLGTTLGGIWADQSWGRFWGWDPKENGALMIVLWCAIIFHARIAQFIGPLGVAVGSVFLTMVVMWAWFGVNLLSVGLHSYGFTKGIATGLIGYMTCEVLFLMIAMPLTRIRRKITN